MKIAISNIIWPKGEENFEEFLKTSQELGFDAVELALNCIWEEPTNVAKVKLDWLYDLLKFNSLQVSALHSLTFTREDLELFGSEAKKTEMFDYLKKYMDLAVSLGCKNIVLGSPKARKKNGKKTEDCNKIFLEFLGEIDSYSDGVNINVEPLHPSSCEYLNYFAEVLSLLGKNNFENIKIQLDVRSFIENDEPLDLIEKYFSYVSHCQVSDPGLSIPSNQFDKTHRKVSDILKRKNYSGFVAGEIVNSKQIEKNKYLASAFKSLSSYYG
ncbi:sugar phosphate isomerase/epimerase family protein [Leptospira vanthielii]|uniref:Xylose isomerase-like TIM barrel domain protein n=1 Tax=Leptospira vanthielii serovar Holland str. Waz Holland = ATCC 700522 TaxID=1218591 RepID=N1W8E6_9LEPT|nr:sugar phosphate isomerase/epimerase [Leptospira vanthielii]EMY69725.1 xylose isomerase-like TIM barrel domain protein [Leptospira vanthielii serovar Holland str. Waz Holland = ATCC 700522]